MPDLLRDLLVGRRACSFASSSRDRALDLARARAHRARHPVHRAQLVDDRALDPRDRVRLELDVAVGVVALDRADQAEQPVRDEVAFVDVRGQPGAEPPGDVLDERRVRQDQPVAKRLVALVEAELPPERLGVFGLGHSQRIRGVSAYLRARTAIVASQRAMRAGRSRDHPAADGIPRPVRGRVRDPRRSRTRAAETGCRARAGDSRERGFRKTHGYNPRSPGA